MSFESKRRTLLGICSEDALLARRGRLWQLKEFIKNQGAPTERKYDKDSNMVIRFVLSFLITIDDHSWLQCAMACCSLWCKYEMPQRFSTHVYRLFLVRVETWILSGRHYLVLICICIHFCSSAYLLLCTPFILSSSPGCCFESCSICLILFWPMELPLSVFLPVWWKKPKFWIEWRTVWRPLAQTGTSHPWKTLLLQPVAQLRPVWATKNLLLHGKSATIPSSLHFRLFHFKNTDHIIILWTILKAVF